MGKVIKLPKHCRIKREKAAMVRDVIDDLEMPPEARAALDNALYSITDIPGARSVFVMVSCDQLRFVTQKILDCRNVATTLAVWNIAVTHVRQDTGEITVSRSQIAEEARTHPNSVSNAMADLEKIGAILKERRGRNVVYKVNPHVAWNGGEGARIAAAKTAPRLYAIDGGKSEPVISERLLMIRQTIVRKFVQQKVCPIFVTSQ